MVSIVSHRGAVDGDQLPMAARTSSTPYCRIRAAVLGEIRLTSAVCGTMLQRRADVSPDRGCEGESVGVL